MLPSDSPDPCAELEATILAGRPARAEDFIAALPPGSPAEQALDLVYAEFLARLDYGRSQLEAELCARFPQWRGELRRQFRLHDWVSETMAAGPDSSVGTVEAPALLTQVGPYRIVGSLGSGGAGVVYRARRDGSDKDVALKVARGKDQDRFRAEGVILARLKHPHIVRLRAVGQADGRYFLALSLVPGDTLLERLPGNPLPAADAAKFIGLLACTVAYVHRSGYVHLDLTPGNVLLTPGGAPKLIDFGSARALSNGRIIDTTPGPLGTPAYLAPEQLDRDPTRLGVHTDIYALGALLYKALVGQRPFRAPSLPETLHLIRTAEPISPRTIRPEIPAGLNAACMKCLSRNPAARYATAAELAAELLRYAT